MWKQYEKNTYIIMGLKAIHLLLSVLLFYVFWILFRYGKLQVRETGFRYNYYVTLLYGVLIYAFVRTYNAYLLGYSRVRTLVFGLFLAQLFSTVITYVLTAVAWRHAYTPWFLLILLLVQLVLDIVWAYSSTAFFFRITPRRRTLLIYRDEIDKKRFGDIHGKPTQRLYRITDEIEYDGGFAELEDVLKDYDAIFVAGVNSRCRNGILKYCKENSIPGFFLPHVGDLIMQEAMHIKAFDSPVLYVNRTALNPEYAIIKRAFDLVSSGLALIVLSPVFLITALAIHFYDGGPVFYKQTRLTKGGKEFKIIKFRSMRVDAEKDGVARLSTGKNDSRITPVGRIVRKYRIDELPQLINIFLGDMSVVGPRPERPEIAEIYAESIPDFKLRLQVKAGLTGYAQIYGKYNTEPYEKLEFDLLYINQMSVLTDLQLCFATFAILFSKNSTEGIKEGQITAINCKTDLESSDDGAEAVVK